MTNTYKTRDIKEYIELANILLEESEIRLVDTFNEFYARQNDGRYLEDFIIIQLWQGVNDVHEIFIDMMNFYADLFNDEIVSYNELQQYKKDVLDATDGFIKNMINTNNNEYFYKGHELPRLQGVYFGVKLAKDEILANMNNSLSY